MAKAESLQSSKCAVFLKMVNAQQFAFTPSLNQICGSQPMPFTNEASSSATRSN